MKHLLSLFTFLLFTATAFCASPSILVTVPDFTLDYSASNRVIRLIPTAATGGVAQRGLSNSDGQVTFASVAPGLWTLTIESVGVPALTLRVPSSSATLSASNLIVSAWTPPTPANSAQATANLAAWALLATDPLTLSGTLSLSGQTNRIADNGTNLTYNGVAVGGDTIWTNAAGVGDNTIYTPNTVSGHSQPISFFIEDRLSASALQALGENDIGASITMVSRFNDGTNAFCYLHSEDDSHMFFRFDPNGIYNGTRYVLNAANPTTEDILALQHSGTNKFTVSSNGLASAVAGFSSTDTTAAVNIAATGWTNTFQKNAVVYYDGISITAKVYDNAGTAIYTNATALGGGSIILQPSGKVILSGTGVTGRAAPF